MPIYADPEAKRYDKQTNIRPYPTYSRERVVGHQYMLVRGPDSGKLVTLISNRGGFRNGYRLRVTTAEGKEFSVTAGQLRCIRT